MGMGQNSLKTLPVWAYQGKMTCESMVRHEFHRSGEEVHQQQWSWAKEHLHVLYTPNAREKYHAASVQAYSRHAGIGVSGSGSGGWRRVRADRQGPRWNLDARLRRH